MYIESFQYLQNIVDDIDDAFQAFYDTMLVDEKLSVFFESDEQIIQLIKKQKEHFKASLTMPTEALKHSYVKLGEFHYDLRIPYIDFIKGTKILEEHFILYAHKVGSSEKLINEIFEYFKIMTSFTAKGYLNRLLAEDRRDIEDYFEQSLEINTFLPRQIVINKFEWLKSLINHIEMNPDKEFSQENHTLHEWLNEVEFLSPQKREFFQDIDNRISINTQNIIYFLKRNEYVEILPLYTSLLSIYKLTLMINNTMTIEYANKLVEQMRLDSLTQLFRRDIFEELLNKEISLTQRNCTYFFSIAFIDLDDFKNINDTYGHYSGDKVIEQLGLSLRNNIRESDLGFRIGGDEFAIIMKSATKENAQKVCEKIKHCFTGTEFVFNDEITFKVSLSIGISEYRNETEGGIKELLKRVDEKLYESKHKGKNQISI